MVRRHEAVAPPAAWRGQQARQRRTERIGLNPARLPARLALHHQQRHLIRLAGFIQPLQLETAALARRQMRQILRRESGTAGGKQQRGNDGNEKLGEGHFR